MRAVRTKADMFERPSFRRRRSVFPIPFPESYRALCTRTFSVRFMSRRLAAGFGRCGEWILKSWPADLVEREMRLKMRAAAAVGRPAMANVRRTLTAWERGMCGGHQGRRMPGRR
jgi:hypothetical protein